MPIIECDPWREQYFAHVPCPAHVVVPTDDAESWRLFPRHRWIFNKLLICETQGLQAGPHGVEPPRYPVFSKPIYNMRGMGIGSRVVHDAGQLHATLTAGHMWMRLLEGEQLSTDVAVVAGEARWWRHTRGHLNPQGTFDYWSVLAQSRPPLEKFLADWLRTHLRDYTGMVNLETVDGCIIECHLRFSDQWPDLYGGDAWITAVVNLYASGTWQYEDSKRCEGFSVVLWGEPQVTREPPAAADVAAVLAMPGISSVQITFVPGKPAREHAMPPGGFRLAVINCWDLALGCAARARLADAFGEQNRRP